MFVEEKHSSLFCQLGSVDEKSLKTDVNVISLFCSSLQLQQIKLERLFPGTVSSLVKCLWVRVTNVCRENNGTARF